MKRFIFFIGLLFCSLLVKGEIPLVYDAEKAKITQFLLKYQVKDDYIKLGDVYLRNSNMGLRIEQANVLTAYWPSEIFNFGSIDVVQSNGEIVYSRQIVPEILEAYIVNSGDEYRNSYNNVRLSIPMKETWLDAFRSSGGVFFCLRHVKAEGGTEICSSPFKVSKGELVLGSKNTSTRVFINGSQQASLIGELPFLMEDRPVIQWFAQLRSGLSWSIKEQVPQIKVVEAVEVDPNLYRIAGYGARPLKFLNDHFTYSKRPFFYEYKTDPFYNERDDYWSFTVSSNKPVDLSFFNINGGVYTARVNIAKVPPLLESPIIIENSHPRLTYSARRTYQIQIPPGSKITGSSKVDGTSVANRYIWTVGGFPKGEVVANELNTNAGEADRHYFLEAFRGSPADIGFQYTLSTISGGNANGSEFHASYWFEDFWGLGNTDWVRLRLGLQAKYFKPQTKIPISINSSSSSSREAEVSSMVVDLKYRFQPGLWGRDETLGLMWAHHDFVFDDYQLALLGAGIFWARSMPKYFNEIFNVIPFLRYPKWVSAEYIQFFQNTKPNLDLKYSYHFNFYGKVNWTANFYGDLGFGLRSYAFADTSRNREPLLNLFFLTFGLGYMF